MTPAVAIDRNFTEILPARFTAPTSEVQLRADSEKAGVQNRLRREPRAEGVVERQHRVRIQDVVQVEIEGRPGSTKPESLCEAQVELVRLLPEHGAGIDQVHRHVRGASRKWTAERRLHR